jgi:hypothetical protein
MTLPYQSLTIRDPGLGGIGSAARPLALVGVAASGSTTVPLVTNNPGAVVAAYGRGRLVDDALQVLASGAGPVTLLRVAGDAAGVASAVVHTGTGDGEATVQELDSGCYVRAAVRIEVLSSGALGVATVRYSLDAWTGNPSPTYSTPIVVPVGGIVTLAAVGLTVTFDDDLLVGDVYTFTVTEDYYASTVPASAGAILRSLNTWEDLVLCGNAASASAAATMAAAAATQQNTLLTTWRRFVRVLVGAGLGASSTVSAAFASTVGRFVSAGYGFVGVPNARAEEGRGIFELAQHEMAGIASANNLISTDLARTALAGTGTGAIIGATYITHDDFQEGSLLDNARISTFRTWPGVIGFFIGNQRMLSSAPTDFRYWQHAGCMLVACRETYLGQHPYMSTGQRTEPSGAINPSDAKSIEKGVQARYDATLLNPKNAEGTIGHVSAVSYTLTAPDLLTTEAVESEVRIRALGYLKYFSTTLQYAKQV